MANRLHKLRMSAILAGVAFALIASALAFMASTEPFINGGLLLWALITLALSGLVGLSAYKAVNYYHTVCLADTVPVAELDKCVVRFNRLSHHAKVLISRFDVTTREIQGNTLWGAQFGFKANVPVPISDFEVSIAPENGEIFEAIHTEIMATGEPCTREIEFYMPAGDLRVYLAYFMPVLDESGHLISIESYLLDTSHQREAARAVQEQMRQTERALGEKRRALANADLAAEAAGIGFATRIEHLRFELDTNAASILGYTTSISLRLDDFEALIDPSYRINFHQFVEAKRLDKAESIEIPIFVEGEAKWLQISAVDHIDRMNRRTTNYSFVDVSDIKFNEARLFEALEMAELKREQAEQATTSLKALQHKQNQMFGVIAHELRTPVAAISMIVGSSDATDLEEQRDYISQAMGDLLHTIDDMKMLVNPDTERPIRIESFDLNTLLDTIDRSVGSTVAASNMSFNYYSDLTPQLLSAPLKTDTYRVKVAVTNLIRNACLHSEGTEVELSVSVMTIEGSDSMIEITVSDNGKGIPEDVVETLFYANERGDTKAEGSGLGLYIASTWLAEIGGSLNYKHRSEGGSEFIIHLPLVPDEPLLGQNGGDTEPQEEAPEPELPFEGLTILLVEDETVIRMMSAKVLENLGATVIQAEDGQKGLDTWSQNQDLIITDYFMPALTGAQMIGALRAQGCKAPVIAVTAATIGEQYQELLSAGADKILSKPMDKQAIVHSVNQFISDGRLPKKSVV